MNTAAPVKRKLYSWLLFLPLLGIVWSWMYILQLSGRGNSDAFRPIVHTREGFEIRVKLPDIVSFYLLLFRSWEPYITHYLSRHMGSEGIFVDIGAHIGYYSLLYASSHVHSGETGISVISFEPSRYIGALTQENISLTHNEGAIQLVDKAVSNSTTRAAMYRGPGFNLGYSRLAPTIKLGFSYDSEVELVPFNYVYNYIQPKRIRFIKIDVEGSETEILSSVSEELSQLPKKVEILCEVNPHWNSGKRKLTRTLQRFRENGFSFFRFPNSYNPLFYIEAIATALQDGTQEHWQPEEVSVEYVLHHKCDILISRRL